MLNSPFAKKRSFRRLLRGARPPFIKAQVAIGSKRTPQRDAIHLACPGPRCAGQWKHDYSTVRPHSALDNLPPAGYANRSAPGKQRADALRHTEGLAPGLTARSALEKFAAVQMIDVHLPATDGREILLTRYTHPEPELQLLIDRLKLHLPPQPSPRITTAAVNQASRRSEDLFT
jgi:hypothetical protein